MAVRIVRLGSPRLRGEGLRLGTARRPPRGVRRADYARLDYYDQWLPLLAPAQKWVSWALAEPWTDARWKKFAANYRREMSAPASRQVIELLARLSHSTDFSVGCYCEDESRCHRSLLRGLLEERGGLINDF